MRLRVKYGAVLISGGQSVIETTSVSTGASTDSPVFNGTFQAWFADGQRFLSSANNTVLTYSAAAVQQDATTVPGFTQVLGTGNWLGSFDGSTLNIYRVGASTSPAATYGNVNVSDVGLFSTSGSMFMGRNDTGVTFIDLSGATPVRTDAQTHVQGGSALAAISPSQWLTGGSAGVIYDGASSVTTNPRYLAYGQVSSIAGSGTRFVISTAAGQILEYDSTTHTLEGTIQEFSNKLLLSADGTQLASLGGYVKIYSLPGGGELLDPSLWHVTTAGPIDLDLSADGTVLGMVTVNSPGMSQTYTGTTFTLPAGSQTNWSATCRALHLSSNGSNIACSGVAGGAPHDDPVNNENSTQLYHDGTLVTALTGEAIAWLDDGHLLVNNYSAGFAFQGVSIVSPAGPVLSTPTLPEMFQVQPVDATSLYSAASNEILSVTDGHVLWLSPDPVNHVHSTSYLNADAGAVAGNNIVFVSGAQLIALTH